MHALTEDGGRRYDVFWAWVDRRLPPSRCAFLDSVGVDRGARRTGIGGALVRVGLDRARADGVGAFLETGTRTTCPIYEHLGFAVTRGRRGSRRRAADLVHALAAASTRTVTTADRPRLRSRARRRDRALLALASPELELLGVTTARQPDAGEDDGERAPRARARSAGPTCRSRPAPTGRSSASCVVAAHVHGESGLDGPGLPPPPQATPVGAARRRLPRRAIARQRRARSRSSRPAR